MVAHVNQMRLLVVNDRVWVIARRNFLQQFVGIQIEYAHHIVSARRRKAEVAVRNDSDAMNSRESIDYGYGQIRGCVHDADNPFARVPRIKAHAADRHVIDKRPSNSKWPGYGDDALCLHRL